MAFLDVSGLLSDPDFADGSGITWTRSQEAVDATGIATFQPFTQTIDGVVTPSGTRELDRLPDGTRLTGAITLHTTAHVADEDTILWHGATYTVRFVDDLTNFGAGFVMAVCELNGLSPMRQQP